MDAAGNRTPPIRIRWWRLTAVALGALTLLLLIFHRPILFGIGRRIAISQAAKENLKLDLRFEGNVFNRLEIRNVRAVPTGPSAIQALDVDRARVHYSVIGLIRHGFAGVRSLEVQNARVVIDPKQAKRPVKPKDRETLAIPGLFTERVKISDLSLTVRDTPHDLVLEHVDLDLSPSGGDLRMAKVQLANGKTWLNLAAPASYENRTLVLRGIVLGDRDQIRLLRIEPSQRKENRLTINLDATIGGGTVVGLVEFLEEERWVRRKIHLLAENVDAETLAELAGLPPGELGGRIDRVAADISGVPNLPRTWSGMLTVQLTNFRRGPLAFDRALLQLSVHDGVATLEKGDVTKGKNELHARGSAQLPADIREFARTPASLDVAAVMPDLGAATAHLANRVSGSAQVNGKIDILDGTLNANLRVSAASIGFTDGSVERFTASIEAKKTMSSADARKPWFADLSSNVDLDVSAIRFGDYALDSVQTKITSANALLNIEQLEARRLQNHLTLRGGYRLPDDFANATKQPARVEIAFDSPELGDFWIADPPSRIRGPFQMHGNVEWNDGRGNGILSIHGSNLRVRDLVVHQISSECAIADNVVYLNDFTASLNDHDFVKAHGTFSLEKPHHYGGKLDVNIVDLAVLRPLLGAAEKKELAGSLVADWEGSGHPRTADNTGQFHFVLEKGRFGTMQAIEAKMDANYSRDGLNVPMLSVATDKLYFQAFAQAKGETLEITNIQLDQGQSKYASGYVAVPFVWGNIGTGRPVVPEDGKVLINFQTENLDIKKLFEDVGAIPDASGFVTVKLDAGGTLRDLTARFDLQMRELRAEKIPKFEPAAFDLTAQVQGDQLNVNGKFQQAKIQPVELTANLPVKVSDLLRGKFDDSTPVTAKVRLPRSSVNFVRQFVPTLQTLDGDIALDVDVRGTIAQPVFSGTGDMTINVGRFMNATLPALQNFKARLNFDRDTLTIEQFGGELAGGPFTLTGGVKFPKLTDPQLDLQLKATSVLVARNDALTARADADIRVEGPLSSANVTGNVATTNSQFLKNIDLIPIGLPGRPAPQPPSARPSFSFPDPPLRDWKFDVTIKTKDPFLIRGNLANGSAISDLHLIGTGLHPGLEGMVRLENVEATLPFSRLEVEYGFLYFDPSDSLNPRIDLHGTSLIRDYTVHVYVYGNSLAPEAVFTSEPPLPQEEIISLLATGTTRDELVGNNDVLAGRAAMLLIQQLYRKVVKKGEPTKSSDLLDRLDLDVGATDPRTGERHATARFKVNRNFVVIGDIGVQGDFRGMVKYVIRFK